MVNESYTSFKGVTNLGDAMISKELENNLKSFLDWCFLGIGGFVNVRIPTTSSFGGNFHVLKPSSDSNYNTGQVWESIRKDWVWETGINYGGYSPIDISGVYINGILFPTGHSIYGHYYDYANGRVIFTGSVPVASSVALEYSYRVIQVHIADSVPWFKEGQYSSLRPSGIEWTSSYPNSGNFAIPPQQRIQFPFIVIETVSRGNNQPYEIGNLALWVERDVILNIASETDWMRDKLTDILTLEEDHIIKLYDTNIIVSNNAQPLDYRGMLINRDAMYPNLVDNYPFTSCCFKDIQIAEVESVNPHLHEAKVRITLELIVGKL